MSKYCPAWMNLNLNQAVSPHLLSCLLQLLHKIFSLVCREISRSDLLVPQPLLGDGHPQKLQGDQKISKDFMLYTGFVLFLRPTPGCTLTFSRQLHIDVKEVVPCCHPEPLAVAVGALWPPQRADYSAPWSLSAAELNSPEWQINTNGQKEKLGCMHYYE